MYLLDLYYNPQSDHSILRHFYEYLIKPAFPSPDELDDIEDWILGLDRTRDDIHPLEPELHVVVVFNDENIQIGGSVWELYPSPRPNHPGCALLSYIVSTPQSRGKGIAKLLVQQMVKELQTKKVTTLLAEMHKAGVSDGTAMDSTERHYAFEKLGFAPLYFPYVQPPLSSEGKEISTDLLLLAHSDLLSESSRAESIVIQEYIDGFCGSVFGFDSYHIYSERSWYKTMSRYLSTKKYISCLYRTKAPWQVENVLPNSSQIVVVVGGGLSGLACAYALRQAGVIVVLMEANAILGGRVKQLEGFASWGPIDLGAEFIHGENERTSPIAELIGEQKWAMDSLFDLTDWGDKSDSNGDSCGGSCGGSSGGSSGSSGDNGNSSEKEKKKTHSLENCRGALAWLPNKEDGHSKGRLVPLSGSGVPFVVQNTKEMYDKALHKALLEGNEMTVKECLMQSNVSSLNIAIIDSIVAQTEAMDMNVSGINCLVQEDDAWAFGSDNFRLKQSYSVLLQHQIQVLLGLGVELWTNTPVHQIQLTGSESDGGGIVSYRSNGGDNQTMAVDRVVVTVPPSVLKGPTPLLNILPSLPLEQQNAIDERNFGRAIKVFVLCRKGDFWNRATTYAATSTSAVRLICCCDSSMPFSQLWCDERIGYDEMLICGFVTATRADNLAKYCCKQSNGEIEIENMLVAQLDEMFGTADTPTPCSDVRIKTTSYDWGTHSYINGGYSSPQLMKSHPGYSRNQNEKKKAKEENQDSKATMRQMFGCVHFAGEATHDGSCATTQSAVLTGERAAAEVIVELKREEDDFEEIVMDAKL